MPTRRSFGQGLIGGGLSSGLALSAAKAQPSEIQQAITRLGDSGGVVELEPRTYEIESPIILSPDTTIRGVPGRTVIRVAVDDISAFTKHDGPQSGHSSLQDLVVCGYADRNASLGKHKLIEVGPFERFDIAGCHVVHGRHMGITAIAAIANVERCSLSRIHRDAINLTGSRHVRVKDCDIEEIGDDAIAVHVAANSTGIFPMSVEISGNRIEKAFGIKVLGAHRALVSGNRLRFYYGYGILVGGPDGAEGDAAKFNIAISGNSLLDGMNARTVGAGDIGGAIILQNKASRGEGGRATNAAAGAWDGAGIQRMDTFVNTAGSSEARGPDGPVAIVGNTIRQTIAGIERFSDAGFGALWSNAGPVDPLVGSLIGAVDGIQVSGDWQAWRYPRTPVTAPGMPSGSKASTISAVSP